MFHKNIGILRSLIRFLLKKYKYYGQRVFYIAAATVFAACCLASASPDWVHPHQRFGFKGYVKHKEQKGKARLWTYATNRAMGNIKGGGTILYKDYKLSSQLYRPVKKLYKKQLIKKRSVLNSLQSLNKAEVKLKKVAEKLNEITQKLSSMNIK